MTSPNDTATNRMKKDELHAHLKNLGIRSLMDEHLDAFLSVAKSKRWSARTILEQLARQELIERERRSLAWRHRDSKIGSFSPIADFDWGWPDKINRQVIERMLTANFVEGGDNAVLVGTQGLGKTMIAKNIVYNAVHKGHTALFVQAAQMLVDLGAQDSTSGLERRLKHYIKPKLLCIDEIGYLSYDQRAADLLFQVVSRRYESKSIIITTNLAFKDWPTVFPGATSVASLIDRLVHHSEITLIEGQSYRKRQADRRKAAKTKRPKK
jgi:DNA replication protein DnaC